MPFHEPQFLFIFLPALLLAWHGLITLKAPKWVLGVLLGGVSALYYWLGSPDFFFLLLALTLFNFAIGRLLGRHPLVWVYWLAITVDLGVLAWFKYSNFAIGNVNTLFGLSLPSIAVVLPLAISFFTFQKVAFLTEVWRGDKDRWSLGEFFLLVWFFPQLVAGPIVRPHEFIPQWRVLQFSRRRMTVNLAVGLTLLFVGLVKKLGIADTVAPYVDAVFLPAAAGTAPKLADAWLGAIAFTVRIYFDFSAYSDMAIGVARIFGFILPLNFFSPYRADSIIEFWRRWHITLSRFLRDFLYVPLGGNRRGRFRRYANLMVVMLLGGLWHGANWTYVVWGGLHGLYLGINHLWRDLGLPRLPRWLAWPLTLTAVVFAWVPFRAPDLATIASVWAGMLGLNGIAIWPGLPFAEVLARAWPDLIELRPVLSAYVGMQGRIAFMLVPGSLLIAMAMPNVYQWLHRFEPALYYQQYDQGPQQNWLLRWRPNCLTAAGLASVVLVALCYAGKPQTYLYWQF